MSYSFTITAATKDEAGKKVEEQLSQVVATQPSHDFDRQAAQNAAEALVGLLVDPGESQEIYVYVCGSLGWTGDLSANNFTSANVSINASVRTKTA